MKYWQWWKNHIANIAMSIRGVFECVVVAGAVVLLILAFILKLVPDDWDDVLNDETMG